MATEANQDSAARTDPVPRIVRELELPERGVRAVVDLFADGNTVPFIARYRKEATGGLDEVAIRDIEERFRYLEELDERRRAVLSSIDEQGKLTDDLRRRLLACGTKAELEDLYLPYKRKRRTRATIARERGLEPLAIAVREQPEGADPMALAADFVDADKGVETSEDALAGARDIIAEWAAEDAEVRRRVREAFAREGVLHSKVVPGKAAETTKFEKYYDYREPLAAMPSHRYLAIRRGEREGILRVSVEIESAALLGRIQELMGVNGRSRCSAVMSEALEDSFRRLLTPAVTSDVRSDSKLRSDHAAVEVFAENLRNLLMAPALGERTVIGIDPGLRTGCKCAVVDASGRFLENITIYISQSDAQRAAAAEEIAALIRKHGPYAIAIGNGTGGRETESFVRRVVKDAGLDAIVVPVNEAGASVYSASDIAREEFPDLDLTVRGAISIARRLQDPLAELVKIDPKSIGVGQYQHDVHQPLLRRKLDEVIESSVNQVGVELSTASAPLLSRVAGIGPAVAVNIVRHREEAGGFVSRHDLLDVKGLGPKAFEQAAGFLRLRSGKHPLDGSAVHPERYRLVERIAEDRGVDLADLVGSPEQADAIEIERYKDDEVGLPTLRDIVDELRKPGRDPRDSFEPPQFREDVTSPEDLEPGMSLEGVVTNVTDFGAFVDVGVHQDGLVHISELADRYVKSPADVVKAGDKIRVRVLEVDLARKRISLSAKSAPAESAAKPAARNKNAGKSKSASKSKGTRGGGGGKPAAGKKRRPGGQGGKSASGRPAKEESYADKLEALKRKFNG